MCNVQANEEQGMRERERVRKTKIQTLRFIKRKYSLLNPACAHRVYRVNECVYVCVRACEFVG